MLNTKAAIIAFIMSAAPHYDVDPDLAVAIAEVESNFRIEATSHVGAIGIMQIMPQFHPQYTKEQLRSPKTNINVGLKLLREYKKICPHQKDKTWVICFNTGPTGAKKINKPHEFEYYKRVMSALRKLQEDRILAER